MSAAASAPARMADTEGMRFGWARQGAESLAAALKIISDLTAQEVGLVAGMVRERLSMTPSPAMAERAGQMVSGITDAGKVMLDLAASESAIAADTVKEAIGLRPGIAAMVDLVPRGMGTLIELQKHFLDSVAEQMQGVVESYAAGKPTEPGVRVARMVTDGIDAFIGAQKMFLDQVAEQVTIATEAPAETKAAKRDRTKTLARLAREGAEKFIDAQRKVLELAMEQVEAGENRRAKSSPPRTSLAEVTRKSVQNITAAQKSLLDLARKPIPAMSEEAAPKPRAAAARRPAKGRKRAAKVVE